MSFYGEFWLCGLGILVSLLLRSCISLHPYSGAGTPPIYGDYEAQRHWMEITVNLPIEDWYKNTTENNLDYWGLDYPPLTAYHAWVCGQIARLINPKYVELFTSRGFESEGHKIFMRYTVLFADILVFIPSVCAYFIANHSSAAMKSTEKRKKHVITKNFSYSLCIVLSLLYPGLILIDHGHFQYNCISLGLATAAITCITCSRHLWASFFFVLSLNYKQMELYHAIPFFIYLLSNCIPKPGQSISNSIGQLVKIGLTVIVTFAILWAPFLVDLTSIQNVLIRLFPIARGVFEDKVSNFWCVLNVFYKLKTIGNFEMARLCLLATIVAILPSMIDLFLYPNVKKFVPSLINCSLAFFLFSFQVHEKTVLLISIPVLLYFPQKPIMCFWFLFISNFSMLPLYIKDNLLVAYVSLNMFYLIAFSVAVDHTFRVKEKTPKSSNSFLKDVLVTLLNIQDGSGNSIEVVNLTFDHIMKNKKLIKLVLLYVVFYISIFSCFVIFFIINVLEPPEKYPDLFALIISLYSCIHFIMFFIYFNICQFRARQEPIKYKYKSH